MKTIKIVFLTALILLVCGCSSMGKSCISVGADYKGNKGDFQYCWEPKSSLANGVPTLSDNKGKEHYIVSKDQIIKANEINDAQSTTTLLRAQGYKISPIHLFLNGLKAVVSPKQVGTPAKPQFKVKDFTKKKTKKFTKKKKKKTVKKKGGKRAKTKK